MDLSELLRRVSETLTRLGLPHFVTGSVVSIHFGDPRFTNDIDIVVSLPSEKVDALCAEFPSPDFYVSEESARLAVTRRRQFNVIHPTSGLKVDLIVPPDTAFNRSRFARAQPFAMEPGFSPPFSSPEDVIVMKMAAYQEGGSEKHLRDIAGILQVSAEVIDREYIAHWVAELGLAEVWERIEKRAGSGM